MEEEFSFKVLELDINGTWRMGMNEGVIIFIAYDNEPPTVTIRNNLPCDLNVYERLKMIPCWLNSYNTANIQLHTHKKTHLTLFILEPILEDKN